MSALTGISKSSLRAAKACRNCVDKVLYRTSYWSRRVSVPHFTG